MLQVRNVVKRFGDFTAVDGVSLDVDHGEFFTLLGPSGCGKTTLLRLIAGFERPDAGSIVLDGKDLADVPPERRPIHTVFQSYALFPHLSVERNVAFALQMRRVPQAEIRERVAQALDEVQLAPCARHLPGELSGGQRQRVAIARALVDRPQLLLLDEPLGALDAKLREQMKVELIKLQRGLGIGFVYVTHDQAEALALSRRIAVMNRGRLEQVADPHTIYRAPASRFVADFIGKCNLLGATVRHADAQGLTLEVDGVGLCQAPPAAGMAAGARGLLALRPEALRLSAATGGDDRLAAAAAAAAAAAGWRGSVRETLFQGDVSFYTVVLDAGATLHAMRPNVDAGDEAGADAGAAPAGTCATAVRVDWPVAAGHFLPD